MCNRNASDFSDHSDKTVMMSEAYKISVKNQYIQNNKRLHYTIPIFGQPCVLGFGA